LQVLARGEPIDCLSTFSAASFRARGPRAEREAARVSARESSTYGFRFRIRALERGAPALRPWPQRAEYGEWVGS
jgi:hypothetical protein